MSAPERLKENHQSVPVRGADASAPRTTPLTLVAGAVAGDTLECVASRVADALQCPVAIAIPAHGAPVVSPAGALTDQDVAAITAHALAAATEAQVAAAPPIVEAVPVRIGDQVVGIVAATAGGPSPERRAWLEAAAAAASVTALIREAPGAAGQESAETLVAELASGAPADIAGLVARARRLGVDLSTGAVALSVRGALPTGSVAVSPDPPALVAQLAPGRVVALAAPNGTGPGDPLTDLVEGLRAEGLVVTVSTPRRDPALLHEAVREAELLAELLAELGGESPLMQAGGHDETYRLLIGVLLRDPGELQQLRDSTITVLADYDGRHHTELLATLRAFLVHDGSTTETAEAMQLHRHTVGYRLSRVQEVSGLSPYESDGRERLSLGIKAQQILDADRRLSAEV